MFEKPNITSTTLLPLIGFTDKLEELGAHLESLLFEFFIGLNIDFLGETDNWLEVNILGFGCFILLSISNFYIPLPCSLRITSGFSSLAAAFWAFADPEVSPRSSSASFFSFLAPPPNIEKTLSATPTAPVVTFPAAAEAALVACSVKV